MKLTDDDRIIRTYYTEEMKSSYIDYAMSVIAERALPDVRDGLKPVQRRILYAMKELGVSPDKPHRKCARIVGDTMGKYHPHGDSSIYDALVRMTQDWLLSLPLVDGHGNFGSIDGDGSAAMRYTEARLQSIALEMMDDLEKGVVDFRDNFDASEQEPEVLPSKLPNLLINGTNGIAVGMATYIPPHNPAEVLKAIISYINNPDITVAKLMRIIKAPDFPTGGIICNPEVLRDIYENGTSVAEGGKKKNNNLRIRAKIEIENASHGKTNLVVTEIPYTYSGSKAKLIEKLVDMVKTGQLSELSDLRDESSMEGIRIVLEVKKGVDTNNLLNKLYSKTPLEDTLHVNFLALVNGRPETLNLKQMIEHYVNFQKEINTRKYNYLLPKAEERREVLEGLIRATDVIDLIIEVLRGSKDVKMAKDCLINGNTKGITFKTKKSEKDASKLDFTERQASAILSMQLQRLVGLEITKLNEELGDVLKNIKSYQDILSNEEMLMNVIKEYLGDMLNKYKQKRKTQIEELEIVEYKEEFKEEEIVILIDRFGYVKAIDKAVFSRSNEDVISEFKHIFNAMNTDKLCVFTKEGNLHQIKMLDIPKGKIKDKGVPIDTFSKIGQENSLLIEPFSNISDSKLIFTTKLGLIKMIDGSEFETIRTQINATKLERDDEVIDITVLKNDTKHETLTHLVLASEKGYVLKFAVASIPELKKNSKGVKAMALASQDTVTHVFSIKKGDANITVKILGKDINISSMKTKKRSQVGVKI